MNATLNGEQSIALYRAERAAMKANKALDDIRSYLAQLPSSVQLQTAITSTAQAQASVGTVSGAVAELVKIHSGGAPDFH